MTRTPPSSSPGWCAPPEAAATAGGRGWPGWGIGAGIDGKSGNFSIDYNRDGQKVYKYDGGAVCTEWHGPDLYLPNSF